jgi:hypothetical protein
MKFRSYRSIRRGDQCHTVLSQYLLRAHRLCPMPESCTRTALQARVASSFRISCEIVVKAAVSGFRLALVRLFFQGYASYMVMSY